MFASWGKAEHKAQIESILFMLPKFACKIVKLSVVYYTLLQK